MTLTNRQYYDEIIGRLIKDGIEIKHYILYAEKKNLEKRLTNDWNGGIPGRNHKSIAAFMHLTTKLLRKK